MLSLYEFFTLGFEIEHLIRDFAVIKINILYKIAYIRIIKLAKYDFI